MDLGQKEPGSIAPRVSVLRNKMNLNEKDRSNGKSDRFFFVYWWAVAPLALILYVWLSHKYPKYAWFFWSPFWATPVVALVTSTFSGECTGYGCGFAPFILGLFTWIGLTLAVIGFLLWRLARYLLTK